MLKNNRAVLALAFIMAIALWAYVLGEVDPVRTITLRNIPIRIVNQSTLTADDLVITNMDHEEVNVTFSAKRSIANKIKEEDFHVTADMSEVKLGENVVKLEISKPSGITMETMSSEYLVITAEKFTSAEKEIEVTIINPTAENTEPKIIAMSDETVTVSGASSLVEATDKVIAELDASRMGSEPNTVSVELKAIDADKAEIDDLILSFSNVSITAVLQNTKTVDLEVNLTGADSGSVNRDVSYPSKVTIKGDDSVINGIESISTELIDLSDVYESQEIPIIPVLPDGVELASDSEDLTVQVAVYNAGTAEFIYNETDVNVTGVGEGKSVKIHDVDIRVTVKGISTVINAATKDSFVLTADASGLGNGSHTVKLIIENEMMGIDEIIASPDKINIDVESE